MMLDSGAVTAIDDPCAPVNSTETFCLRSNIFTNRAFGALVKVLFASKVNLNNGLTSLRGNFGAFVRSSLPRSKSSNSRFYCII